MGEGSGKESHEERIEQHLFGTASAAATGIATAALLGGLWFVLPLSREVKDRRTGSDD